MGAKKAIIAVHGIGQQNRFETLNGVFELLGGTRAGTAVQNPAPGVGPSSTPNCPHLTVDVGNEKVDIFEAYWAPHTEGVSKFKDSVDFLYTAGVDGVKHSTKGRFTRRVDGESRNYPVPKVMPLIFLGMLTLIASISIILSVVAATGAKAISSGFTPSLWNTIQGQTFAVGPVALVILLIWFLLRNPFAWVGTYRQRMVRHYWVMFVCGILTFVSTCTSLNLLANLCGVEWSVVRQVFRHQTYGFNSYLMLLGLCALALWLRLVVEKRVKQRDVRFFDYTKLLLLWLIFLGTAAWCGLNLHQRIADVPPVGGWIYLIVGTLWVILFGATAFLRRIAVGYVGDLAVYLSAHRLSAFQKVRHDILQDVESVFREIYASKEYDSVYVVSHSLGTVIAYDVLNRLMLDMNGVVRDKTKLFLTFGSPLDKTAFIFETRLAGETAARDMMAEAGMPLVRNASGRPFPWVNLWSPQDVISGSLEYFDTPEESSASGVNSGARVWNLVDPNANITFVAHGQFWGSALVKEVLLRALAGADPRIPQGEADRLLNARPGRGGRTSRRRSFGPHAERPGTPAH